jgi:SAM-dependent methyltransferase
MAEAQQQIDRRNASFWDELCQTAFARQLGVDDASPENLARFDAAYLAQYPYLVGYLPEPAGDSQRLLEVGLGYGTVSQVLGERGFDYQGLDIAEGPVEMVRERMRRIGLDGVEERVRRGSVHEIPHPDASFDHVVSIGCLHHTGDIERGVEEVRRVLRPGGRALVMLYNRHSFRRMRNALRRNGDRESERATYDQNLAGDAAPATDFTSVREAKRLFSGFSEVRVRRENFDHMSRRGKPIDRGFLLGWPARLAGLDLYVTATR